MWGILVGLGLGFLEVFILKKLISAMTESRYKASFMVPAAIMKLALILAVLWIMAKFVSIEAMVWCAAGCAAMMIGVPVATSISTIKKYKQRGGEHK